MASLEQDFRPGSNSIGALRFVAASMVIVGHSYPFGGYGEDALKLLTNNQIAIGRWPVDVFFVLSGFLLSRSLERTNLRQYAVSRFLRIFPAFWACLLVSGFIIPICFGLAPGYWYIIRSAPLFFGVEDVIPGLFVQNPNREVNSALWTLPFELYCYISLAIAYVLIGRKKPWLIAPLFAGVLILFWGVILKSPTPQDNGPIGSPLRLATFFYAGATMYVFRAKIPMHGSLALASILITATATTLSTAYFHHGGGLFYVIAPFTLSYMTLYTAIKLPFTRFNNELPSGKKIDLSYGIYIYGSLVLQCLTALGYSKGALPPYLYMIIAYCITLVLSALSWFWVEAPALALKSREKSSFK